MTETTITDATRPATMEHRRIAYQPALDGLRAVAVMAVLLYHHHGLLWGGIGRGGFIGVDVFFVLSGYLITTLLVAEHHSSGSIAIRRFWARRARRLIPAFLAMLVLVAVLARLAYPSDLQAIIHQDVLWSLGYLQNWHLALWHGVGSSPLSHTWSVSVEEQWYLVWPVAFAAFLVWARGRLRSLAVVLCGLVAASALWSGYLIANGDANRAYFGTDTRAQELLVGAVLAVMLAGYEAGLPARISKLVGRVGLVALIALSGLAIGAAAGNRWPNGSYLALALGAALVITAAVQPHGPVRSLLGVRPLVVIGGWSYGLYLFHLPLFRWLNPTTVGLTGVALLVVRVGATTILAIASFTLLEQPIRRGRFSGRGLVAVGVLVAAGVIAATTIGIAGATSPPRSKVLGFVLREAAVKAPRDATKVLVVGGRRAALLGFVTKGPYDANGIYGLALGTNDCGLTTRDPRCSAVPDDVAALAGTFGADVVVLMADELDASEYGVGPRSYDRTQVVRRLDEMRSAIGNRRIVLLPIPCVARADGPTPTVSGTVLGTAAKSFNALLATWATRHSVSLVSPSPRSCAAGRPLESSDEQWRALADAIE